MFNYLEIHTYHYAPESWLNHLIIPVFFDFTLILERTISAIPILTDKILNHNNFCDYYRYENEANTS